MRILFSPGIAVMHRLSNEQKPPIMGILFTVSSVILFIEARDRLPGPVARVAGVSLFLAGYLLLSFYLQVHVAWALFLPRNANGRPATVGADDEWKEF